MRAVKAICKAVLSLAVSLLVINVAVMLLAHIFPWWVAASICIFVATSVLAIGNYMESGDQ